MVASRVKILEKLAAQTHPDFVKTEVAAAGTNVSPALLHALGLGQLRFEVLQTGFHVNDAPEPATEQHAAGRSKLGVVQLPDANPHCASEQNYDQAAELVMQRAHQKRENRHQAA